MHPPSDDRWERVCRKWTFLLSGVAIGCGSSHGSGSTNGVGGGGVIDTSTTSGGASAATTTSNVNTGSTTSSVQERQSAGWDDQLRLPEAQDENPDPNVFETDIEAKLASTEVYPGTTTEMWTYNGAIPGPLIRAKVGDRVVVHFRNQLPESTTLHWHGVRLPNAMDGVPDHTQPGVGPGQTFTYDFTVPDGALFWYHPHVNSAKQVGDGLYGALLVMDPSEPPLGDELVLVLSDASVNERGELAPADESGDFGTVFGREGNVLLVNGKVKPTLQVRSGLLQRWRLVNGARSRYYQLAIVGHGFRRIGGDGGLIEYPIDSDRIVLAPAERADVLIVPQGEVGSEVAVRSVPFDRGFGTTVGRPDEDAFYLRFVDAPQNPAETLPMITRVIEPLVTTGATEVELELMQVSSAPLQLGINGLPAAQAIPLHAAPGETQVWAITSDPEMQFAHPFHLHGFFFQPLDDQGQPVRPLEWKDTINVPVNTIRRFAVRFDDRVGMWMFHCHILDHADAGMMGMLELGTGHPHN